MLSPHGEYLVQRLCPAMIGVRLMQGTDSGFTDLPPFADDSDDLLTWEEWNEGEHFVLQMHGESLPEEHIADGDFVLFQQRRHIENGKLMAILNDDKQACLARVYREKGGVRIEHGRNSVIHRAEVQVLGILVGVVRRY